jgi:predicted TIM-barrel enzyme
MSVDAKALQLVEGVECVAWKDGAGAVYAVPSVTDPLDFHIVVDLERLGVGRGLRCDCVAGAHRQVCSHTTAVVLAREQRARQQSPGAPGQAAGRA